MWLLSEMELNSQLFLVSILAFIWVGKRISKVKRCLGRVVDILEASGAFDPGSNPGRGVKFFKS